MVSYHQLLIAHQSPVTSHQTALEEFPDDQPASQGCCNNITFGDDNFGYYETVAGGSGAGPGWNGRSGVHVHMTNTRLTDPEILERRYPVVLEKFCLAGDY